MLGEGPAPTLQPTELVHETYLKLLGQHSVSLENRAHFFGAASTVMREILVDYARSKRTEKRGGTRRRIDLDENLLFTDERSEELIALDEALKRLAEFDPRQNRIVELRFFGGLTEEETAQILGISTRTVKRDWRVAKAWLFAEINQ
jgi:RNA polymerase sigma factor (TIGR02999 family)